MFHGGIDVYNMSREDGFNMYLYNLIGKIIQNLYAALFFLSRQIFHSVFVQPSLFSSNCKILLDG